MTDRRLLIAGNWKMNLNHLEAIALVQKLAFTLKPAQFEHTDVVVLPPFTDLRSVQTLVDGDSLQIQYGAQDVSPYDSGAYTGDISGPMLAKLGCRYVAVGHSERRDDHYEGDHVVNIKTLAAFRNDIVPILCVGENLEVRQAGDAITHCKDQLAAALQGVTAEQAERIVLAYEPIWAIGTGEVATPDDAQDVCAALRQTMAELYSPELADGVRVIYGGSMKPSNALFLLAQPDIDGGLIGGASLVADDFAAICITAALATGRSVG